MHFDSKDLDRCSFSLIEIYSNIDSVAKLFEEIVRNDEVSEESKKTCGELVFKILVIESFKYLEIYKQYKSLVHKTGLKNTAKNIYKILDQAKITDLRNR